MSNTKNWLVAAAIVAALSPAAQADQVIADDLIVTQSICVGTDCVNGEVFGFDTLKLKENNLRIKFEDTSNSGSFPSNDWQLTANDSANGGQNKFSIDDISGGRTPFTVEAGAPSHSLYVDDGGRVGFGTSTPAVQLHVVDGNTPALRLAQDGSSGFTPQTWDLAGNETNFFVRDVTNSSKLPFRIRPSAPTNSIYIDTDGDVGMGNNAPAAALHVSRSTGTPLAALKIANNAGSFFELENTGTNDTWFFTHENVNEGSFIIASFVDGAADGAEFTLTTAGNLTIAGQLITGGPQCPSATPCDGTFASDFEVPSVEEHSEYMWKNSYLKGVGSTSPDKPFNLTEKAAGMLHELEVAHIYIEQLHGQLKAVNARLKALEESK